MSESNGVYAWKGPVAAGTGDRDSGDEKFLIGDLAREFGVTLRALRFYENRGLLSPERRGSQRLYSRLDRERLSVILTGKRLGFTLAEIRRMVAEKQGQPADLQLTADKCLEQIALLEEQKRGLEAALLELRRMHAGLLAGGSVPKRLAS